LVPLFLFLVPYPLSLLLLVIQKAGGEVVAIEDVNWRDDSKGLPGRQLGLHLLLRVVADVGIVGFPNAGASALTGCSRPVPPTAALPGISR
jgi:hypothetical protein